MQLIYKYAVPIGGHFFDLELPMGAKILAFQTQEGHPMLWALVEVNNEKEMRHFAIRSTGEAMSDARSSDTYIGTIQIPPFVWHLFETEK